MPVQKFEPNDLSPATSSSFGRCPITNQVDKTVADTGAGVDFVAANDMTLLLEFGGQFGDNTTQSAGSLKATLPF